MRILTDNTGKGQLEVLSVLAEESGQKQKEIVASSALSKGSVSNNVRKLREKNLVQGNEKLSLNEERVLQLYREHLETFLIRDSEDPEELNELRTFTKTEISDILEKDEVLNVLTGILQEAGERQDIESLNSVFKEADRVLYRSSEDKEIKMMTLTTDKSNTVTDNQKTAEEAQEILDEVKE